MFYTENVNLKMDNPKINLKMEGLIGVVISNLC